MLETSVVYSLILFIAFLLWALIYYKLGSYKNTEPVPTKKRKLTKKDRELLRVIERLGELQVELDRLEVIELELKQLEAIVDRA